MSHFCGLVSRRSVSLGVLPCLRRDTSLTQIPIKPGTPLGGQCRLFRKPMFWSTNPPQKNRQNPHPSATPGRRSLVSGLSGPGRQQELKPRRQGHEHRRAEEHQGRPQQRPSAAHHVGHLARLPRGYRMGASSSFIFGLTSKFGGLKAKQEETEAIQGGFQFWWFSAWSPFKTTTRTHSKNPAALCVFELEERGQQPYL